MRLNKEQYEFLLETVHDFGGEEGTMVNSGILMKDMTINDIREWSQNPIKVQGLMEAVLIEEGSLKEDGDWDYDETRERMAKDIYDRATTPEAEKTNCQERMNDSV